MPTLFARIMSFIIILFLILSIIIFTLANRTGDISPGDLTFLVLGTILCVIIILYYISNLSEKISVYDNIMEISKFKLGFIYFNKTKVRIPYEDIVYLSEFQSGMGNRLYVVYKTKKPDCMGKKIDIASDENKDLNYVKKYKAEYFPAYDLREVSCRSEYYLKDLKELADKVNI
jgi:hypothetical protein